MSKLLDYLKAAGGEASLFTKLGFWRQAVSGTVDQVVDTVDNLVGLVALISGGGLLPATGTMNGARPLSGYNTALLQTGDEVFVQGINEIYYFDATSALTADGLNVVNAVGPGQFIRSNSVIVQADWYIDSVAGDDENLGTVASPLKTLAELTRRTEGRILQPSIVLFTVHLTGTFPTEPLVLNFSVAAYCWIQITAATTVDYTGSITGFTTYSAGVTAALLSDTAAAFAVGDQQKRVRLTSGAGIGACSVVLKRISSTQIRVSDFYTQGTTGYGVPALTATPANGTTYVIESLPCQIGGLDVVIDGAASAVLIRDVEFIRSSSDLLRSTLRFWSSALSSSAKLFGCRLTASGANMGLTNSVCGLVAVAVTDQTGAFTISDSSITCHGLALFTASMTVAQQGSLQATSIFQQSLTAGRGMVNVTRNGVLTCSGNWAAYDLTGDAALVIEDNAYVQATAATVYWGIGTGTTYGIRCRGKGAMDYVTEPTISGGTNDTIIGGTATAWGAVPYINPANNCAITLKA